MCAIFDFSSVNILILKKNHMSNIQSFTVTGFANLRAIKVDRRSAIRLGRAASKICRDLGIERSTTQDERWGIVGTYPISVLERVFSQEFGKTEINTALSVAMRYSLISEN